MTWRHIAVAVFAGATAFLLARWAQGDAPATKRGQELYMRYCASCHGPTAKGDGLLAEAMKKEVPDLRKIAARRNGTFPRSEITNIIDGRAAIQEHGSRTMPVWGTRLYEEAPYQRPHRKEVHAESQILQIVTYLKSIQVTKAD